MRYLNQDEILSVSGGQSVNVGPGDGSLSVGIDGSVFNPNGGTVSYNLNLPVGTSNSTLSSQSPDYSSLADQTAEFNSVYSGNGSLDTLSSSDFGFGPSINFDFYNYNSFDSGDSGGSDFGNAFGFISDGEGGVFYGEQLADD